nr:reverse transcriptase domain-containing protein [Tanacetum cinerariifolium]
MREDSKILIILGRSFLATAQAMIDVFNKKITLRVGNKEVIFDVDQSIKRPPAEDDECYRIDFLDTTIHSKTQELLEDDQFDSFLVNNLEESIDLSDLESCGKADDIVESRTPIRRIEEVNTSYLQETKRTDKAQNEHLYSASTNEIDKKRPVLKDLPSHLKYAYLKGDESCPVIISSKLTEKEKVSLFHVLEKRKGAIAWKMSDIKGIRFFQILIAPEDQKKTTFTCPYGTFAYRRMPFRLCNALMTFQRRMMEIFHDMVEDFMEVFMDDFSGIEVDKAKIDVISKLPYPSNVKGGAKNLAADHLSRLENPNMGELAKDEITDKFLDEHLMILKAKLNDKEPWGNKYILVEVDYVFKWIEAQELPINDARVVVKFLKGLFARFGVPKALISDRGTYFCNSQLEKALLKYKVSHKISTAYHSQTNGQTKVTNMAIKRILERSVGYNPKDWSEKLNDALWTFRTAYKTPTGCTLFRMVYGKACHLSVEIDHKAYWALKQCNMDLTAIAKNRFMELNELMELRDGAYENTRIYKERTKRWHDSRIHRDKNFINGDKVLLFNSRLKLHLRKLKSKCEEASLVVKRPLDASKDTLLSLRRPVDEVSSVIEDVFDIDESNVEGMHVRDKFAEFFEDKESVENVLSATKLPKGGNSHSAYSLYHLEDKMNFEGVGNVTPWTAVVERRKRVKYEAFSLACAEETRFTNLDIWEFLRSNPSNSKEDFFKARITEARFEIIAKEDKEYIVEKKIDIILRLQGEFASPKDKGSLNADEYIGVEEVVGGGKVLGIGEDDDIGDAATDGGDSTVESGDISILNSLIGHGRPRFLQLCKMIVTTKVLIDKEVDREVQYDVYDG